MKTLLEFAKTPAGQLTVAAAVVGVAALVAKRHAVKVAQAVNPINENNVFYTYTNEVGQYVTGAPEFDLGHWIYDKLHGKPSP